MEFQQYKGYFQAVANVCIKEGVILLAGQGAAAVFCVIHYVCKWGHLPNTEPVQLWILMSCAQAQRDTVQNTPVNNSVLCCEIRAMWRHAAYSQSWQK